MKRSILTIAALICLSMSSFAQVSRLYEVRKSIEKPLPVKGGVGIEQFYLALAKAQSPGYYEDITSLSEVEDGEFEIDKPNGYISYFQEGDGSCHERCCYWNRADGTKLFGYFYFGYEWDGNATKRESLYQFYTYNETTKCLDAINEPWSVEMDDMANLTIELPRKGKDIKYGWIKNNDESNVKLTTLTWNGYDFRQKGTPASTIKVGSHMLKLQWIEGVDYGSCQVKATAKKGEYTVTGTHYNKAKTDWLKIDGKLTVIDSKRLRFDGTIKTRISHIAGGKEQIRRGNMDFLATGSRKYWRLQQMYNPGDQCVDYVDIFF